MRTHIHHLTAALAATLIGWSSPAPLPASDYGAADFLPLAVGNSWTFLHLVSDRHGGIFDHSERWPAWEQAYRDNVPRVTITVERTEVFGDTTDYVLSGMPASWPPAPPHCPVGKKLRWKGSELMERTDTGERSFFRFDGPDAYTIPWTHGDDEVSRHGAGARPPRPSAADFRFSGNSAFDWLSEFEPEGWNAGRWVGFLAGYGLEGCSEWADGPDYGVFHNRLQALRASLVQSGAGGASGESGTPRTIAIDDARRSGPPPGPPSSASSSSWGQFKERR